MKHLLVRTESTPPETNAEVIRRLNLCSKEECIVTGGFKHTILTWIDDLGRVYFREISKIEDFYKTKEFQRQNARDYYHYTRKFRD